MLIIGGGRSYLILILNFTYNLRTDTVVTSFPAKNISELSMDDSVDERDFMEGDWLYDSTDIWRAVQKELRGKTTYGQRTAKSALDLAWTIIDQATGVFQKRNLHPHLQFLKMFEIEIDVIVSNCDSVQFKQQLIPIGFQTDTSISGI